MLPHPHDAVSDSSFAAPKADRSGGSGLAGPQPSSVTVVVCTRDRPALLETCLEALCAQSYPDFDVLVVDNGTQCSARKLCERFGAAWIAAPIPGLTRARNIGARSARGELVAYVDDDSLVEPHWLDALVAAFADPRVGAVSGRVRYMRALPGSRGMSDEEACNEGARRPGRFDSDTPGWFTLACFGGVGDGGNMAFRRALIDTLGFDERIGRGRLLDSGDEHIVFAKLIEGGKRIVHVPEAVVRHPSPPTPELQAARRYSDLRSSISHLLFVWGEFPAHRRDLLRFLRRAVLKRIAPRAPAPQDRPVSLPRGRAVKAMLGGLQLYWRARAEWSAGGAQAAHPAPARSPAFMESNPTVR